MEFVRVPGRVNLIGEHIDYHNLPVLPMAIQRSVQIRYQRLDKAVIRARSECYGSAEIDLHHATMPDAAGAWTNYLKASIQAVGQRWHLTYGIEATVTSDLPAAAGLSSSSALMTGFAIALLRANSIDPSIADLMEVLPDAEQFVGTRGGGMDHAAVLGSCAGAALLVEFAPLRLESVPISDSWKFIVAHSLKTAEKSGGAREQFNARRVAGQRAFEKIQNGTALNQEEERAHRHVVSEGQRVGEGVAALRRVDEQAFGKLLCESHASLRDNLQVSCPELDELVNVAMESGALGARLTGAGFGGCAIVFCRDKERERIAQALVDGFYARRAGFERDKHLIFAEPSAGALHG